MVFGCDQNHRIVLAHTRERADFELRAVEFRIGRGHASARAQYTRQREDQLMQGLFHTVQIAA